MKNFLLCFVIPAIIFASCTKKDVIPDKETKEPEIFTVKVPVKDECWKNGGNAYCSSF